MKITFKVTEFIHPDEHPLYAAFSVSLKKSYFINGRRVFVQQKTVSAPVRS